MIKEQTTKEANGRSKPIMSPPPQHYISVPISISSIPKIPINCAVDAQSIFTKRPELLAEYQALLLKAESDTRIEYQMSLDRQARA